MSPGGWLLVFLLAGALPLIPAVMRPGADKTGLALGVGLLLVDLLMVAATVWALRGH